ncbi:hypothetical protein F2Q69_00049422 [Brassica cretica]|uniref:MATH domain-containing protein n=1 Tax=Brassica cretica TaxID=69181 RepID=A0A8S9Q127_BRACR|nr:hypothetical protein F2Q69_00049422 [Brassica cretica]
MGEEQMEKRFSWVLKKFSSLQEERCYSRSFGVAGVNWRLLAYPKGDKNDGHLSLYLEFEDPASLPPGWSRDVKFTLALVTKAQGKTSISTFVCKSFELTFCFVAGGQCCFDAKNKTWGYTQFVSLAKLHEKSEGFLVNNRLIILAELHVLPAVVVPEETLKITTEPLSSKDGTQADDTSVTKSQRDSSCEETQNSDDDDGASEEGSDDGVSSKEDVDSDDDSSPLPDDGGEDISLLNQFSALEDASHTAETEVSNDDAPKDDVGGDEASNDSASNGTSLHQVRSLEDASQTVENGVRGFNTVASVTGTAKEPMDVNGFDGFSSQVESVSLIFRRHPDIALGFRPKNRHFRRAYMNELLSLIEMLCQSPEKLSEDDLSNADETLADLIDVGFKLDWLKTKLDEVSEKKKKEKAADGKGGSSGGKSSSLLQRCCLLICEDSCRIVGIFITSMGTQVGKKFAWVIKNFSSLKCEICYSAPVLIGDRKWRLYGYPKGDNCDYLSLYLEVVDWKSLPSGWRRFVKLRLSVAKQSFCEMVLVKTHPWFDKKISGWGFPLIPLTKLHDDREGFLEDGDLIVVAEVDVLEVVGTLDEPAESKEASSNLKIINGDDGVVESNDYLKIKVASFGTGNMDINGFQVVSVKLIFERHRYIAVRFRAMNQHTRKACMNILLRLIETLCQSLDELSSNDILGADTALAYLKSVHFNVAWLEKKLDLVKGNKDKEQSSLLRLQEMEDNLLELKQKCSDLDALVENEEAEFDKRFSCKVIELMSKSEKCCSVPVLISDCKWRLVAFPKGNNGDYLSLYLDVADFETLPCGWRRYVKLRLTVVNQLSPKLSVVKGDVYLFLLTS